MRSSILHNPLAAYLVTGSAKHALSLPRLLSVCRPEGAPSGLLKLGLVDGLMH